MSRYRTADVPPALGAWRHRSCGQIQAINKGFDKANRVLGADILVQRFWKEQGLGSVVTGDVAHAGFYPVLRRAGILPNRVFTRSARFSKRSAGSDHRSHVLAILNEFGECRDLVVEGTRPGVGLTCVPVDTTCSPGLGAHTDGLNHGPTDTPSARNLNREHVLQIADGAELCSRTVKKVVNKADHRLSVLGDQRMHRLKAIEETPPRHLRHFLGDGAAAICLPKRFPARAVVQLYIPDYVRGGQFHSPLQAAFQDDNLWELRPVGTYALPGSLRVYRR
jgi:hypothetical protein